MNTIASAGTMSEGVLRGIFQSTVQETPGDKRVGLGTSTSGQQRARSELKASAMRVTWQEIRGRPFPARG